MFRKMFLSLNLGRCYTHIPFRALSRGGTYHLVHEDPGEKHHTNGGNGWVWLGIFITFPNTAFVLLGDIVATSSIGLSISGRLLEYSMTDVRLSTEQM